MTAPSYARGNAPHTKTEPSKGAPIEAHPMRSAPDGAPLHGLLSTGWLTSALSKSSSVSRREIISTLPSGSSQS